MSARLPSAPLARSHFPEYSQSRRLDAGRIDPDKMIAATNAALYMTRSEFIALVGGSGLLLATKVRRARAQQPAMPVIGFLSSSSSPVTTKRIASFSQGLSETGYVAGRDIMIEPRLAEGQYDRLPALAAELVTRQVNVIAALAPPAAFAAKAATTTIPIVFVGAFDPVKPALSPVSTGRAAMSQA